MGAGRRWSILSKSDDVKHWLDAIEPAERRREVAIALAARAALRVDAAAGPRADARQAERGEILSTLILPTLRAAALSWVAGKYPAHGNELQAPLTLASAFAAADAEADDADDIAAASVAITARSATLEAADAAFAAV